MVGVIAGLVPCPLTLFAIFFALSRGVPEAGLTFAVAMMLGVGLTLGAVAP
jgi:nickel/cobalt exporter